MTVVSLEPENMWLSALASDSNIEDIKPQRHRAHRESLRLLSEDVVNEVLEFTGNKKHRDLRARRASVKNKKNIKNIMPLGI